ncbi:hypothetical protein FOL47_002098, partial [Perkinsus chesapeaki]
MTSRPGPKPQAWSPQKKYWRKQLERMACRCNIDLDTTELLVLRHFPPGEYITVCKRWILLMRVGKFVSGDANGLCMRQSAVKTVSKIVQRLGAEVQNWWARNQKICIPAICNSRTSPDTEASDSMEPVESNSRSSEEQAVEASPPEPFACPVTSSDGSSCLSVHEGWHCTPPVIPGKLDAIGSDTLNSLVPDRMYETSESAGTMIPRKSDSTMPSLPEQYINRVILEAASNLESLVGHAVIPRSE